MYCEYCHSSIHAYGCPNAAEPFVFVCCDCKDDVYEWEVDWGLSDGAHCSVCTAMAVKKEISSYAEEGKLVTMHPVFAGITKSFGMAGQHERRAV